MPSLRKKIKKILKFLHRSKIPTWIKTYSGNHFVNTNFPAKIVKT